MFFWTEGRGQFFANPSFEGPPGIDTLPPSWQPFDEYSTPDTEPLDCDYFTASDGLTYITLVTRGEGHDFPGTSENIFTTMSESLEPGRYYQLSVDLASRDDVGHFSWEEGFVAYTLPVILRVYATDGKPLKGELLSESEVISHEAWGKHHLILIPRNISPALILEVANAGSAAGWGNLLLDNLEMEEIDELPLDEGDLVIPNVFTPNGDGINDLLVIKGLRKGSSLLVYDRTGKEVFISTDYGHDWDGRDKDGNDLSPGTYWYVLFPSHLDEVYKGNIYLKRMR